MKLVVDTNTLVSGSLWHGPPACLLSAALAGQARMFLSVSMLLELRKTLQQPKFAQRLAGIGETAESLTERFRAACHEAVPGRILNRETLSAFSAGSYLLTSLEIKDYAQRQQV